MEKWNLREATNADTALLASLAREIYREYYLHLWLDAGEWYQEAMYNEARTGAELADPNNLFFIASLEDHPVAYLKLRKDAGLEEHKPSDCLELERIYIRKEASGQGLGRLLVSHTFSIARSLGKRWVFLKAMDSSLDAIGFYERMGFVRCGELTLPYPQMKEIYRGMVIMKHELIT